jgi:hypothetical protein
MHFLCTPDRRQRLDVARRLTECAMRNSSTVREPDPSPARPEWKLPHLFWRWTTVWAATFLIILAILLGLQVNRLRQETQAAQRAQNEADRLHAMLALKENQAATFGKSTSSASDSGMETSLPSPSLELSPDLSRGIQAVPVLRRVPHNQPMWIRIKLPFPSKSPYRDELIVSNGDSPKTVWTEELKVASNHASSERDLGIPAFLLAPGDYLIVVEEASAGSNFEKVATYAFRVAPN